MIKAKKETKEVKKEEKPVQPKKSTAKKVAKKADEQKPETEEKTTERYRVVYDKEEKNWIVRIDGGKRASRRCATKEEALKVAKDLAKKKDANLSVHKMNGKFQKNK